MSEFLQKLFATDFMPHGHCYFWQPAVLWLHTSSDAFIALSYFSIPAALIYFVRRRHDLVFHWIFVMFGIFIFACGTTHLMNILTTWYPAYRIEGVVKLLTALVSMATAVALWPLLPKALALPSPKQLREVNQALLNEVEQRKRAEEEVRQLNRDLEARVAERTREIERTNAQLREDIAARRLAEARLQATADELQRSNAELERFAYVASHDLKAPLQAIDNLSTWITEDLGDALTGEPREQMEMLRARVRRMEALLDALLEYSRAARVQTETEAVDVGELFAEVVDLVAPPRGFTVVAATPLPVLEAPRLPLQQVLMNLIGNAVKHHGGTSGRIEVAAKEDAGFWRFSVVDDGPGIAPEFHERIFEMFQTLRPRDEVEGTGIGLAIVKKMVEAHGGTIAVASQPGAGATFNFTWPKHRPQEGR